MGPCERFSHPTHTSSARYWPATSQSDREVGKTAKTHVHAEYDGVAVKLHQDTVGQLYQAECGAGERKGDAVTGCLRQGFKATGI